MESYFYIPKEKYTEFKEFIRNETPSVRFISNPYLVSDKYRISISSNSSDDSNKINSLISKWDEESEHLKASQTKKNQSWWSRIKELFNSDSDDSDDLYYYEKYNIYDKFNKY